MRARETFYQDGELARVRASIRKSQRWERVAWLIAGVMVLAGLGALGVWLIKAKAEMGNGEMGNQISAFCFPVSHLPLALAPVTKGALGVGFLLLCVVGLAMAVWKTERQNGGGVGGGGLLAAARVTELVDPFAECVDGLDGDEMHRILVSVAAEAREVRHLQTVARTTLSLDDAEDVLVLAGSKMDALIRCVEALCGRLCPVISGDEKEPETRRLRDWEMGRRKVSKTAGKPSYAELAAVVIETAVYMRGDSSFDESGRVARIICEAAARLEGGAEV